MKILRLKGLGSMFLLVSIVESSTEERFRVARQWRENFKEKADRPTGEKEKTTCLWGFVGFLF